MILEKHRKIIKPTKPRKPNKTPAYCLVKIFVAKKATPTNNVNIGVSEFIMAATAESIGKWEKKHGFATWSDRTMKMKVMTYT